MAEPGQIPVSVKHLQWALIPAIILTLIYLFTPAILWVIDRVFRKPLGQRLFKVHWNLWGIAGAVLCWLLYWLGTRA